MHLTSAILTTPDVKPCSLELKYGPRFLRTLTVFKATLVPQVETVTLITLCPASCSWVSEWKPASSYIVCQREQCDLPEQWQMAPIKVPSMEYTLFRTRALELPSQCANERLDTWEPRSSFLDRRLGGWMNRYI